MKMGAELGAGLRSMGGSDVGNNSLSELKELITRSTYPTYGLMSFSYRTLSHRRLPSKAGHPRLRIDYRQIQIRRMDEIQIQMQFKAKPGQPDEDFICAFSGPE